MTAGSVGASAAPISPDDRPGEVEHDVGGDRDQRGGAERAEHAERDDRHRGRAEASRARSASRPRTGSRSARASRSAGRPGWRGSPRAGRRGPRPRRRRRGARPPSGSRGGRRPHGRRARATSAPETTRISSPNSRRSSMGRSCTSARRPAAATSAGPRLTLSLRRSHPQPTRRTDTAGTHAPRASHCASCSRSPSLPGGLRPRPAGSLSVEDARGTVVLKGKGIVIGRLERGEVEIVDLSPLDQWSPRVNGVPRGRTVWTRGKNINFYVPGGRYLITVRGEGFSVSARGQGTATLTGRPDAAGATGTYRRRRRHARRRSRSPRSASTSGCRRPSARRPARRRPRRDVAAAVRARRRGRAVDRVVRLALPEERRLRRSAPSARAQARSTPSRPRCRR